jgi:hypothetical protein
MASYACCGVPYRQYHRNASSHPYSVTQASRSLLSQSRIPSGAYRVRKNILRPAQNLLVKSRTGSASAGIGGSGLFALAPDSFDRRLLGGLVDVAGCSFDRLLAVLLVLELLVLWREDVRVRLEEW